MSVNSLHPFVILSFCLTMPSFLPYQHSAEMAAQQDTGKAEDALFLADMLLAQVKVSVYLKQ